MSTRTCDRAALVEAMVDGRLGPAEQSSLEHHLRGCPECAELLRDLTSLRRALRTSSRAISPLEHQRARLALLRQAATPPTRTRRPVARLAAAAVTLPLAVWAASSLSPWRSREVPLAPASSSASIVATAPTVAPAQPSPADEPAAAPSAAEQATAVPTASIQNIHTGAAPRLPPRSSGPAQPSSPPAAPPPPAREDASARPAPAAPSAPGASHEFNEAMAALSRGDFGASASKLDGFAAAHPGDPRAEEAAYLQAIALERAGRLTEARAAARRYLTLYPAGAHRAQARRLAGD